MMSVCRIRTDKGVQDVPDLDELFEGDTHIRTGKLYYRNSTFKVYYHQRQGDGGPRLPGGVGTVVIFQLDNSGKFTGPVVDDDVFYGVVLL